MRVRELTKCKKYCLSCCGSNIFSVSVKRLLVRIVLQFISKHEELRYVSRPHLQFYVRGRGSTVTVVFLPDIACMVVK